ncbi:MAG: type VII toxin-antitoxin system MntA family adenylyltransferase antitoxin [Dethiobacteria bacterium]
MKRDLIKEKINDLKSFFCGQDVIATVYLFGSYGTELYDHERSDIDLAIIYRQALTLKEEMLIDAEITLILESDNVDVVNLNKARVDISYHVLAMGKIIYERDKIITANFVENILKHYFDHGIALEKMKADTYEVIKEDTNSCD